MSFDALLNKTCNIQTLSETQLPSGQKQATWTTTISGAKCRIDAFGGQEQITASMVYEKATHIMFIRNPSTITLDVGQHRVISDSITYNILLVKRMYGYSPVSHLEVLLEIIK